MEENKIILDDFFFFCVCVCVCVDFVFIKHLDTTLKWSVVISGDKVMDSYESNCTSFTFDHFIKLW